MSNEHLTDERIQEILDDQTPGTAAFLPWHVKACPLCRKRFQEYERIYSGLAAGQGFVLPPGFTDSVLARIPASRESCWKDPAVWIAGSGALALLVLALLVGWMPPVIRVSGMVNAFGQAFAPLAGKLHGLFPGLRNAIQPFLFGGLGLLGAALVERMLRRQLMRHGH